jgi:hypothetical protein
VRDPEFKLQYHKKKEGEEEERNLSIVGGVVRRLPRN